MSSWLKRRAVVWCAVAMLLGGGWWVSSVRAQNEVLAPASTPEAAATNFMALLASLTNVDFMNRDAADVTRRLLEQSISRTQRQKIEKFNVDTLESPMKTMLLEMISMRRKQDYKGRITDQNAGKAVVELQKVDPATLPPIVCVAEDGGWRVDLFDTYAKWKGLSNVDRDVLVAAATGEVSPDLAGNSKVMEAFIRARDNGRRASCQSNLKQISLGMMMYVQDYDEALPPAREWGDVLQPYVKSQQIFRCPSVPDKNGYGYAFNSRLSKKNLAFISQPSEMVSVYETTNLSWNAYGMGEKPAFRHLGGANYAFADGHIKWLDKTHIPQFTFRP